MRIVQRSAREIGELKAGVLETLKRDGASGIAHLAAALRRAKSQLHYVLEALRREGRIETVGVRKQARYVLREAA